MGSYSLVALLLLGVLSACRGLQPQKVLIIGGTRFSGNYLWKELVDRGHSVTLYNRGKTDPVAVPGESEADFERRVSQTDFIVGDRKDAQQLRTLLGSRSFDVCYDMNGREAADTEPLVEALKMGSPNLKHFVYMSSAGVYKKSEKMPHVEGDEVDFQSRHKGKLNTEELLARSGLPWTSIRPTYIYGAQNYNPLEQYFFERIQADRPVCVPGYGGHLTGLGHVKDLAVAMSNVIGCPAAIGKVYNVQDDVAISFDGLVRACAAAAGKNPDNVKIVHYDPKNFDFGKKKAFPLRPQHFFTDVEAARRDLRWEPQIDTNAGLKDAYVNDFCIRLRANAIQSDFECDDMILNASQGIAPSSRSAPAAAAPQQDLSSLYGGVTASAGSGSGSSSGFQSSRSANGDSAGSGWNGARSSEGAAKDFPSVELSEDLSSLYAGATSVSNQVASSRPAARASSVTSEKVDALSNGVTAQAATVGAGDRTIDATSEVSTTGGAGSGGNGVSGRSWTTTKSSSKGAASAPSSPQEPTGVNGSGWTTRKTSSTIPEKQDAVVNGDGAASRKASGNLNGSSPGTTGEAAKKVNGASPAAKDVVVNGSNGVAEKIEKVNGNAAATVSKGVEKQNISGATPTETASGTSSKPSPKSKAPAAAAAASDATDGSGEASAASAGPPSLKSTDVDGDGDIRELVIKLGAFVSLGVIVSMIFQP